MAEEEPSNGYCSSSGEEDGDAAWRAAIDSVAGANSYVSSFMNGLSATKHSDSKKHDDDDRGHKHKTQQIKHYQLKVPPNFIHFSAYMCMFKLLIKIKKRMKNEN